MISWPSLLFVTLIRNSILLCAIPKSLPALKRSFMRRTSGHCVGNLIYVIFVKLQMGCHPVAVVHYTHTHIHKIHRTTQNKQYTEQYKNFGRVRAVPRLSRFYPGVCLTTEEKAWQNLSQGSRRVPAG